MMLLIMVHNQDYVMCKFYVGVEKEFCRLHDMANISDINLCRSCRREDYVRNTRTMYHRTFEGNIKLNL